MIEARASVPPGLARGSGVLDIDREAPVIDRLHLAAAFDQRVESLDTTIAGTGERLVGGREAGSASRAGAAWTALGVGAG